MTATWTPHYKIVPGSSGSFLCPPGHPAHRYSLEGYETTRKREPFTTGNIEQALADDFDGSEYIKNRVQKIFDESIIVASELWVRSVYGYFRNMYTPEDGNRSADKLINHNPAEIAVDRAKPALDELRTAQAQRIDTRKALTAAGGTVPDEPGLHIDNYRRGVTPLYGRRRGWEVTAKRDGTRIYVYALADDGTRYDADHLADYASALEASDAFTNVHREPMDDRHAGRIVADVIDPPQPMDPQRHAAVACIRTYFPDHEPRLDLIDNPGKGYGSYPCTKCGERVQYEAKLDKLTVVTTRVDGTGMTHWSYGTECTDGTDHTTEEQQ